MKSAPMPRISGRITAGALTAILILCLLPAMTLYGCQMDSPELGRTRSMAEAQHEIVMLLIKKKEYAKAATEAHKIFEMKWPQNQEPLLLHELLLISDQFRRQGQAPLGLQFIESSSKCFKTTPSRIAILKERGYLYKTMNQNDKAINCFRMAWDLEDKN
jgi:tetratricopeptide (TPR) repeat protein